jgi:hypothetical protein
MCGWMFTFLSLLLISGVYAGEIRNDVRRRESPNLDSLLDNLQQALMRAKAFEDKDFDEDNNLHELTKHILERRKGEEDDGWLDLEDKTDEHRRIHLLVHGEYHEPNNIPDSFRIPSTPSDSLSSPSPRSSSASSNLRKAIVTMATNDEYGFQARG